ncbi:MAG: hypothetical protein CMN27_11090 [Salinisphaera sp.]|nr:hypothetical protein [Salinisphaera sp.]
MLVRLYFDRSLGPHFNALETANGQWLTTVAFCFNNYDEVDVSALGEDLTDSEETARNRIRRTVARLKHAIEDLIPE